jgi:hypothetical protein
MFRAVSRVMSRVAPALAALLLAPALAAAQEQNTGELIGRRDIPARIRSQIECGTDPDIVTRHAFAGGYLFAWECASNHANFMQALVYAERYDGTGARLLRFPQPKPPFKGKRGAEPLTEIANKRLFPNTGEIVEAYIDPEGGGSCRFEGRWKLAGAAKEPVLTTYRQTADCRGRNGWVSVISADATGSTQERPRRRR